MWRDIYPLVQFRDPAAVWEHEPTFVICEVMFVVLLLLELYDGARRGYAFYALVAAFVGGALIELGTIMHSEIGNFYHSQAVVMLLGGHEPFYMLFGTYGSASLAIVLCQRFAGNLSPGAEAAFGGLTFYVYWAILDTIGFAFLWWTWHNTELIYTDRDQYSGVPHASGFWITASGISLVWLLRYMRDRNYLKGIGGVFMAAFAGAFAYMVLMNIPFNFIFHPLVTYAGYNAEVALYVLLALCGLVLLRAVFGARERVMFMDKSFNVMLLQSVVYIITMTSVVLIGDPSTVRRYSYGQPLGTPATCLPEPAREPSFWGAFSRESHVCAANTVPARDHFDLRCTEEVSTIRKGSPGTLDSHYYTICGVAKSEGWYHHTLTQIAVWTVMTFVACFISFKPAKHTKPAKQTKHAKSA
eukprot:TRINITY_DN10018_c0_g1_i1.p1 TRINITY_DN10018_c0_g1~~TRINITY_DN10018_c0_g1_i1.p1  ORF type:complete len:414 (+),score=116.07 TRINITY_DN10018_c0_g1_i1:745-1986(+)